jgi:hypothetical protein
MVARYNPGMQVARNTFLPALGDFSLAAELYKTRDTLICATCPA